MMQKSFLAVPCLSFNIKNFKPYFITNRLIKGFFVAILFSLFIYLEYLGIKSELLLRVVTSISSFFAFYFLLKEDKIVLFWSGFFIGIFWFYWVGFSFRYFEISFLIPFVILAFGLIYGFIFYLIGCFLKSYFRALIFLGLSFFHPFGFNWFVPELVLVDSWFDFTKIKFAFFLASIVWLIEFKGYYKFLFIIFLIFSIRFEDIDLPSSKQKIYLSSRQIPQDKKWTDEYREVLVEENFKIIQNAIKDGYDIVVLSESVFPYFLNTDLNSLNRLLNLSKKISIVTGSLYTDGKNSYNSAYYFINGEFYVANKVVLVPFSERMPLPKFLADFINKIFFEGASDFSTAKKPTDIPINGEIFRNAICYEATSKVLYQNNPKFMIAISNNAWFTPSIEPILQKLLLRFYSRLYHTTIYHSANGGISGEIKF